MSHDQGRVHGEKTVSPAASQALTIVPVTLATAKAFVATYHRHHRPPPGGKFCLGVTDAAGRLCGVAMVGRPIARILTVV